MDNLSLFNLISLAVCWGIILALSLLSIVGAVEKFYKRYYFKFYTFNYYLLLTIYYRPDAEKHKQGKDAYWSRNYTIYDTLSSLQRKQLKQLEKEWRMNYYEYSIHYDDFNDFLKAKNFSAK